MKTQNSLPIKCLVWDLDNTVWDGVLMEDPDVRLDPLVRQVMVALDERGILNSVVSRNDPAVARAKLEELGLAEFLVAPQIGWNAKAHSVASVVSELGIAPDALGFVDDDPFERAEVASELPDVRCFAPDDIPELLGRPEFNPLVISDDARRRRLMYQASAQREADEEAFVGPKEHFLAGLGLVCEIYPASESDVDRAEELTIRTHQLNTTGITYSAEELRSLIQSARHLVLVARLSDRYGTYGTVGLAVVELGEAVWRLPLLLMSCRVMSRGAGGIVLGHVMRLAAKAAARLQVPVAETGRNRMMVVTLRFAGFRPAGTDGTTTLYEHSLQEVPAVPSWVEVRTGDSPSP